MAKLKELRFRKTGKNGEEVDFASTVTITQEGLFHLSVPEYLYEIIITFPEVKTETNINCFLEKGKYRVITKVLDKGRELISRAIDEYLSAEEIKTIVILYEYITDCSYAVKESVIAPNAVEKGFIWQLDHSKCSSFGRYSFTVGIRAAVFDKTEYKRGDKSKTVYPQSGHGPYWLILFFFPIQHLFPLFCSPSLRTNTQYTGLWR